MRRYLSADGDVTVDDDDVTVDVGDVKLDTIRLPSTKPIMRGPGYHVHVATCVQRRSRSLRNRLGEALKL